MCREEKIGNLQLGILDVLSSSVGNNCWDPQDTSSGEPQFRYPGTTVRPSVEQDRQVRRPGVWGYRTALLPKVMVAKGVPRNREAVLYSVASASVTSRDPDNLS